MSISLKNSDIAQNIVQVTSNNIHTTFTLRLILTTFAVMVSVTHITLHDTGSGRALKKLCATLLWNNTDAVSSSIHLHVISKTYTYKQVIILPPCTRLWHQLPAKLCLKITFNIKDVLYKCIPETGGLYTGQRAQLILR